ncbi:MAG: YtxH domain-containing protein [Flavobacteriaceae bacterium]|nr:YtxH domain-containing protein [Flavobacteriaceae bacterium]
MNNNSGNVLLALLTGAAIGGIAGILYAPDKGEETRKRLKDGALKTRDDLNVRLHKAADELTKTADAKKADFDRRLDETISTMSYKADDIIGTLERKLADLRKKNAELQK